VQPEAHEHVSAALEIFLELDANATQAKLEADYLPACSLPATLEMLQALEFDSTNMVFAFCQDQAAFTPSDMLSRPAGNMLHAGLALGEAWRTGQPLALPHHCLAAVEIDPMLVLPSSTRARGAWLWLFAGQIHTTVRSPSRQTAFVPLTTTVRAFVYSAASHPYLYLDQQVPGEARFFFSSTV
jgi:hypothetical protein